MSLRLPKRDLCIRRKERNNKMLHRSLKLFLFGERLWLFFMDIFLRFFKNLFILQGVAQSGSASVLGTEGHGFKSCHPESSRRVSL